MDYHRGLSVCYAHPVFESKFIITVPGGLVVTLMVRMRNYIFQQ